MPQISAIGSPKVSRTACFNFGFTLIELLVVLTILVMCSALIPWSISRTLPGRRVAATAERIKVAIFEAQAQSAATSSPQKIVIDAHRLTIGASNSGFVSQRIVKLPETIEITMQALGGQSSQSLTIYPDGATTGGQVTVAAGNRRSIVTVSALTGRTRIQDGR